MNVLTEPDRLRELTVSFEQNRMSPTNSLIVSDPSNIRHL